MKSLKYIEVVRSQTKGLSSMSTESARAIVQTLSDEYANVTLTNVNTTEDLAALIERKPDVVFLGMMYVIDSADPTRKIWVSEQLEAAGIPHTGSPRSSHELEHHKDKAKQRVLSLGLATAPFTIINVGEVYTQQHFGLQFPLFVKPLSAGGGKGVDEFSIVRTLKQLNDKVSWLHRHHNVDILIEQYLEGREFSVAVIRRKNSDELIAMPLELIAPKDINGERMLGSSVKSLNQEQAIAVSDLPERALINKFALDVFRALGARDYGRIDIRLDGKGVPHFLEANLTPSLISGYGSFPKAYKLNLGVEYKEMISNITELAFSRTLATV